MMTTLQSYVRQGKHSLRKWAVDPRVHLGLRAGGHVLLGLMFSAASLRHSPQPLVMSLVCCLQGWQAVLAGLGGSIGYLLFWGASGAQGVAWTVCAVLAALFLGERQLSKDTPLLLPALSAAVVAVGGPVFQFLFREGTAVPMYLLRIVLAAGTTRLFILTRERQDPIARWIVEGLGVLALAQIVPIPYLGLGYIAAGIMAAAAPFPAAALAGLALDLADITLVPMTAVICLAYFVRLIPMGKRWLLCCGPGIVYIAVMGLCNLWDLRPVPALFLGGWLSVFYPGQPKIAHRRGETGIAQVRLEMLAGVYAQMEQLLLEEAPFPVDESAVLQRAAERACGSCPGRKGCREREKALGMSAQILHRPLLDEHDLPISCRKPGRLLSDLHRAQEQLRAIRGNREQQREYRAAVVQQYRFLAEYMQDLSDSLGTREQVRPRFQPQVAVCGNRPEADNGDRVSWFAGTQGRYFVVLCDGMGRGMGAVDEGNTAMGILKKLLSAGFPAEYALRSLNSICALRGKAGAVTVDLAELHLDTGKALVYKWGAAPSYLVTRLGAEKIGTAGPPPGLSVTDARETVERLSLRRGETLLLLSDGVGGEDALRRCVFGAGEPPGELAARVLACALGENTDDATVAAIRLSQPRP